MSGTARALLGAVATLLIYAAMGCGDDEKPESGYYIGGKVFNALTLDPVKDAELTLITAGQTSKARSSQDGSFSLGPIPASSSYRVETTVSGMKPFQFNGMPLPKLAEGRRALVADVPLYPSNQMTPAFKVIVRSGNPHASQPPEYAAVDFTPLRAGTDPGARAKTPSTDSSTTSGAYSQGTANSLPNDAPNGASAYHLRVMDGEGEVPEGALSWGTTYSVHIDGGPTFKAADFSLTPVRADDIEVQLDPVTSEQAQELPQDTQQYFTGRIYDGVTMGRLTDYEMRLEYYDRVISAQVDDSGRFVVGPLLRNADYSIVVEAEGYRSFISHNQMLAAGMTELKSFYYDAFLFPSSVVAPAVNAKFTLTDSVEEVPSGTVRFSPRSGSSLFDSADEMPAAITGQIWSNDEDIQQRTVVKMFTDGQLELAEGELVLGVQYAVTVFGVKDHEILDGGTFRAGVDLNPTFALRPLEEAPLAVVATSRDDNPLSSNGSFSIRFNHEIGFSPVIAEASRVRAMNDAFLLDSPDTDGDMMRNTLVDSAMLMPPIAADYRGVHATIAGSVLTLSWNREKGLATADSGDAISSVTYGGLSEIWIVSQTAPTASAGDPLSDLWASSVTVLVTPQ